MEVIMKYIKKVLFTVIISLSLVSISPVSVFGFSTNISIETQAKTKTVYITKTGKKYHAKKCGKGKYTKTTLAEAKKAGLTPCKKCYGK
jgi:hypothetical protein